MVFPKEKTAVFLFWKGEKYFMEMKKRIKSSKRGLTFSFDGFGEFVPGKRYRYILEKDRMMLMILPVTEDGQGLKISRKKCNGKIKSLFDLRNKDVLSVMSAAKFLEVAIEANRILVTAYAEKKVQAKEREKVITIDQYMEKTASYEISREFLKASGQTEGFYQYSMEDIFGSLAAFTVTGMEAEKLKKDLPDVLRVISLFSGAGMLDLPFAQDKAFSIVYAAEHDKDAIETYRHNIGDHIHEVDVRNLKGSDLPRADIIIGGCPCQPYSRANPSATKRGANHEEGDLLKEYVRLVKETDVRMFLIENVPQFLSDAYGENMRYIKEELEAEGY